MKRRLYNELESFKWVYLEDSYVLRIEERPGYLQFTVEVVLTEQSPFYAAPLPREQYCYKIGRIVFPEVQEVIWKKRTMHPSLDASGEVDLGNIDEFFEEDGRYTLVGDWGKVEVVSQEPELIWI